MKESQELWSSIFSTTQISEEHNKEIISNLTKEESDRIIELHNLIPEESKTRWPVVSDDMTLYRFLQARKWVVEDAWKMLEAHLKWGS